MFAGRANDLPAKPGAPPNALWTRSTNLTAATGEVRESSAALVQA
jgi:hypothetical protein